MIFCRHVPAEPLTRFVDWFWYFDDFHPAHRREHVLPDGTFELVIDLREEPRKLFDRTNVSRYTSYRRGWLSGTHSQYIVIDALPASSMIGVHFKPGGAVAFLGRPADEVRDRVVELETLWGSRARQLRERLLYAQSHRSKFRLLEEFLLDLLARRTFNKDEERRTSWTLERFLREPRLVTIGAVVQDLGISHRKFIEEFRRQVGLTPKLFCRIRRFQEVVGQINSQRSVEWADVACDCGYFDQSHFVHDFQAFAGLNPTAYLTDHLDDPKFVPIPEQR